MLRTREKTQEKEPKSKKLKKKLSEGRGGAVAREKEMRF
jgi:hypothetical protein